MPIIKNSGRGVIYYDSGTSGRKRISPGQEVTVDADVADDILNNNGQAVLVQSSSHYDELASAYAPGASSRPSPRSIIDDPDPFIDGGGGGGVQSDVVVYGEATFCFGANLLYSTAWGTDANAVMGFPQNGNTKVPLSGLVPEGESYAGAVLQLQENPNFSSPWPPVTTSMGARVGQTITTSPSNGVPSAVVSALGNYSVTGYPVLNGNGLVNGVVGADINSIVVGQRCICVTEGLYATEYRDWRVPTSYSMYNFWTENAQTNARMDLYVSAVNVGASTFTVSSTAGAVKTPRGITSPATPRTFLFPYLQMSQPATATKTTAVPIVLSGAHFDAFDLQFCNDDLAVGPWVERATAEPDSTCAYTTILNGQYYPYFLYPSTDGYLLNQRRIAWGVGGRAAYYPKPNQLFGWQWVRTKATVTTGHCGVTLPGTYVDAYFPGGGVLVPPTRPTGR